MSATTPAYQDRSATIYAGKNLDVLPTLPDGSVDCVVTSPPYFGLRDYGVDGQYGAEKTPAEFVANLVATFREVRRVLAGDGTLWLNIDDSYGSGRQAKNLLGIPWRVALALQDDDWVLRNANVWHKTNAMPDPARDRFSRKHETVFMLTRSRRYYFDLDAVKVPSQAVDPTHAQRYAKRYSAFDDRAQATGVPGQQNNTGIHSRPGDGMVNPGDVWKISTVPFKGAHFATFPPALARRCIQAGCKPSGTVLDPFHGAGTTGMVARELGRKYVGIELNPAYIDLSLQTRMKPA